jgi:ABC-type protease/lipase transport system fused ATPase/permease subunit
MKENEGSIVKMIGKEKYDEECEILNKFVEFEKGNGAFQYVEGAVDTRPENLKDIQLSKGFQTQCGIKGGKLSGGQK